jgi:predicted nucleic acid-binding protein
MATMSKALDITAYHFAETDKLFFDANVWMYIYGPQGAPNDFKTRIYSAALAKAIQAQCCIFTDVLVISEFINRFARIEHQTLLHTGRAPQDFKSFRNNPGFQPIASAITAAVRNILKFTVRLESGFSTIDINAVLTEFDVQPSDFNDQIIVGLCLTNQLQLVTHDSDFKGRGVDILTANRKII